MPDLIKICRDEWLFTCFWDCKKQNEFQYSSSLRYGRALCHCRYQEMDLTVRLMDQKSIKDQSMHLKEMTGSFIQVTIELQYANEIDSDPYQSFIQFSRHKRLKKDNWMVLYRITSRMLCNSMLHYVGPLVSWSVGCAGWSVGWSPFFFLAI